MRVLFGVESPGAATTRYRVVVPARELSKLGHTIEIVERLEWPPDEFKWDLVMFQRNSTLDVLRLMRELEKLRVPFGYDIDDDIFAIETTSPVFGFYLKNPSVPWQQLMAMRFSAGLTVSTARLKHVYGGVNSNIRILPNCVSLQDWQKPTPRFDFSGAEAVIVWAGSATHLDSLTLVYQPLLKVLQRHPKVVFVLMGFDAAPLEFPSQQTIFFGWSTYPSYQVVLRSAHIGLAPLAPSAFNMAKSDLRIKEYACAGLATLGSAAGEYAESLKAGGGISCSSQDEWEANLEKLIAMPDCRREVAQRGSAWVSQWDISLHAAEWVSAWEWLSGSRL